MRKNGFKVLSAVLSAALVMGSTLPGMANDTLPEQAEQIEVVETIDQTDQEVDPLLSGSTSEDTDLASDEKKDAQSDSEIKNAEETVSAG